MEQVKQTKNTFLKNPVNSKTIQIIGNYLRLKEKFQFIKLNKVVAEICEARTIFYCLKKINQSFVDVKDKQTEKFREIMFQVIDHFYKSDFISIKEVIFLIGLKSMVKGNKLEINASFMDFLKSHSITSKIGSMVDQLSSLNINFQKFDLIEFPIPFYRNLTELKLGCLLNNDAALEYLIKIFNKDCQIRTLMIDCDNTKLTQQAFITFIREVKTLERLELKTMKWNLTEENNGYFLNSCVKEFLLFKTCLNENVLKNIYNNFPENKLLYIENDFGFPNHEIRSGVRRISFPKEICKKFYMFKSHYEGFNYDLLVFPNCKETESIEVKAQVGKKGRKKTINVDATSQHQDLSKLRMEINLKIVTLKVKLDEMVNTEDKKLLEILLTALSHMPLEYILIESKNHLAVEFIYYLIRMMNQLDIDKMEIKMPRK
jgi:hypothetical protein